MSQSAGEELDAIMRDLDATGSAWAAAGYLFDGPEFEAREAVFARLKEWNAKIGAPWPGKPPTPVKSADAPHRRSSCLSIGNEEE